MESSFLVAHEDEQVTQWLQDNKSSFFWILFGYLFITLLAIVTFEFWAIPLILPFAHAFIRGALLNSAKDIPLEKNSVTWIVAAYCAGIFNIGLGAIIITGHLFYILLNQDVQSEMERTIARWMITIKSKLNSDESSNETAAYQQSANHSDSGFNETPPSQQPNEMPTTETENSQETVVVSDSVEETAPVVETEIESDSGKSLDDTSKTNSDKSASS